MADFKYKRTASAVYRRIRDNYAAEILELDPNDPDDQKKIRDINERIRPLFTETRGRRRLSQLTGEQKKFRDDNKVRERDILLEGRQIRKRDGEASAVEAMQKRLKVFHGGRLLSHSYILRKLNSKLR